MAPLSGAGGECPLKDSGLGQASPLSHVASSDPSPQLSFPSHCWLFGMHFPLPHLMVSAGQSGKHKALSRGSKPEQRAGGRAQATPPCALTALQLITVVSTVIHAVTDPEEGLAELVLARELVGGIAFWMGQGQPSAGEAQWECKPPSLTHHSASPGSCLRTESRLESGSRCPVSLAMEADLSTAQTLHCLLPRGHG